MSNRIMIESSIVIEVTEIISNLFIFFYEKIPRTQRHLQTKNQLTKQKQANKKQQRQQFCARKLLRG